MDHVRSVPRTMTPHFDHRVPSAATPLPQRERGVAHFTPLAIDLAGLRCLVVGGGRVGTRKALGLVSAGADVTVLSPAVSPSLRAAAELGLLAWRQEEYGGPVEDGFFLVVAATSDPALNERIGREARGALTCVVSSAAASRVIFPAVHMGRDATVAVHSDGRDCRRSQQVRDQIASWMQGDEQLRGNGQQ